jgi:hypothetical protein
MLVIFWDVIPYVHLHFEGRCCLHLQGRRVLLVDRVGSSERSELLQEYVVLSEHAVTVWSMYKIVGYLNISI